MKKQKPWRWSGSGEEELLLSFLPFSFLSFLSLSKFHWKTLILGNLPSSCSSELRTEGQL